MIDYQCNLLMQTIHNTLIINHATELFEKKNGDMNNFEVAQKIVAFAKVNEPWRFDELTCKKVWVYLKYIRGRKRFKKSTTTIWRIT